jgi:hypothetical protein
MSLLTLEKFQPRPLSEKELDQSFLAVRKRAEVYGLMDTILPASRKKPFWRRVTASPKTPLPPGDKPESRPGRAWLERDPDDPSGAIAIMMEEISDGRAISPKYQKLQLERGGTLRGEEFLDFTPAQHIDLMIATEATVLSIKAEAAAAARETAAVDPIMSNRFFARMFSSLSS